MVEHLDFPKEMQVEVKLDVPTRDMFFQTGPFKFSPQSQRLVFAFTQLNANAIEKAKEVACKVLDLLPHTPFAGVGWNLFYSTQTPTTEMTSALNAADINGLSANGYEVSSCSTKRSLVCPGALRESKVQLNLILNQEENGAILSHFHFHRDCKKTTEGIDFLRSCPFNEFVSTAEQVITKVYKDQIENPVLI